MEERGGRRRGAEEGGCHEVKHLSPIINLPPSPPFFFLFFVFLFASYGLNNESLSRSVKSRVNAAFLSLTFHVEQRPSTSIIMIEMKIVLCSGTENVR